MADDLAEKVETMKREIDALQISVMGQKKPWYKEVPVIVSVLALLFSFGTTLVSFRRTEVQDVENRRQELRGLLQRLAALPKENVEVAKKYAGDTTAIYLVGGYINQENEILAREAAEIALKLPKDDVFSTEYYGIGLALGNSYDLQNEKIFLKLSEDSAKDFNTEIAALRSLGNLEFIMGQPDQGRVEYQKALGIFSKYQGYDPFTVATTNIATQVAWASSEMAYGARPAAEQHIQSAEQLLTNLPAGPGTDMARSQVAQARNAIQGGGVPATPAPGSPLTTAPASSK